MKKRFSIILSLLLWANLQAYSQTICHNTKANAAASQSENLVYKEYLNQKGKEKKLHIELVRPTDNLPDKKRPLIIGLHGSGFINTCISEACYLKYSKNVLTKNFTPQGFITASIEYRLASPFDFNPFDIKDDKLREVHFKAVQDARQAIKFIFENAAKLGIDTNNVFLIGTSAGAITALSAAFLDNEEVQSDLLEKYGQLEKREKIKGVISLSGATYDLSYLNSEDKIPLMIVHGKQDFIVPIDKGFYLNVKHLTPVYGGRAVFEQAQKKGIPVKGFFYDFGHSYPESLSIDIFKNTNDFIQSNLTCSARN
ncbi:MAG: alpha/beta hydrolase [Acidobacteriota bacterium]|nr:alpha/beta hydrolase [Acidobacteriota bacterium]